MPAIQNATVQAKPADYVAADENVTVNPGKKFSGYQACTVMTFIEGYFKFVETSTPGHLKAQLHCWEHLVTEMESQKSRLRKQSKISRNAPSKVSSHAGEHSSENEDSALKFALDGIDDSDTSESSIELEKRLPKSTRSTQSKAVPSADDIEDEDDDDDEEEDEEEDIPVSDLEDLDEEDREDMIPHTRLTINNTSALLAALERIAIPTDKSVPFATHQIIVSSAKTAESIPDVSDDLQRELAFYTQCLDAARQGRSKLLAEGVPFSRPKDYFAEMVKEDAHMEKVKAKLIEEASAKKASAEARKLRDLKKFGKQVQVAKLQERQRAKRETLEKIKTLKRKRQESGGDLGTKEGDLFDVAVDDEISKHSQRSNAGRPSSGSNTKRQKKNEKFGFGGKKKHIKSGDAMSSGDLSGFNPKRMKAGSKNKKTSRPGKSRRKAMSSK
ncbi:rRNA processing protein [Cordyceps fumosorosea ARSEF 2679]|uniref:rRNA processing protein n=1 Tax=Cordyceps fumosorosea (strain ARSEF 2679) TaxID=1081104 RepID=A0A167YE87_CORFA|nr:rRNA processing protein [Cordyceps fumosorosea ARSEF 2679]OAA66231.1 rRNA processing protein [Cordyceps fumosorosea ARSEF 2679]